ncbi:hypothetical protein CYY_007100 [Polysphondylium violaceum]|uniref:Uncharacterized protein n=1 Tax=Polysphondylium violaceum TaxID=133409 RepID=A0A8J4PY71_9MYCE|nr:hypothetical protein CYY_007100 [Polysphondylium violaceum]
MNSNNNNSNNSNSSNDEIKILKQEISKLKKDLKQTKNEKNLLEFKNQLLLDMLTLSSLDVKYFEDLEREWNNNKR